jgi:AbiU2
MRTPKTDDKNIELSKLLTQLRAHIDLERIIALNDAALRDGKISRAFLGYLQKTALESLAIYFCKIFESSTRNDLNSIPGIIESLPAIRLSEVQKGQFAAFGKKYGNYVAPIEARSYLKASFGLFCGIHCDSLDRLKEFRDTVGAHSDSEASIDALPSHAEFETFFGFANDFYELVSRSVNNVGPGMIPRTVGHGYIRIMESMGYEGLRFDFDEEH